VFLILVLTGHLIWLFERKRNPEQFPETYLKGVWESSWWAISTILSGGCDAKGPNALGGRIVGAAWMLVCIVFITYFTASITTIMTVNQLTSDINGPRDLPGKTVATVQGSTAETYLKNNRVAPKVYPSIDAAFTALGKKQVQAVVYDSPMLLYHLKSAPPDQQVVGGLFQRQNYGIAVPQGSPHRKAINEALLKLRESGVLDELNAKWFGKAD
jgi:polar amino acid transport system substrate-binding protein